VRRSALVGPLATTVVVLSGVLAVPGHAGPRVEDTPSPPPSATGAPAGPAPAPAGPVLVPTAVDGSSAPVPTPAGVTAAVRRALTDSSLGLAASAVVSDPATGQTLYADAADAPRTPASSMKILTALAVLDALGPDAVLPTRVVQGDKPSRLVLVGGGDPLLATSAASSDAWPQRASLEDLADRTARGLDATGTRAVTLRYDASLFSGPTLAPGWPASFPALGLVAPVTALMVDGGRAVPEGSARVADPAAAAAARFAALLGERGVSVRAVSRGRAPAAGTELARVESASLADVVEFTLTESDNTAAEVLAHLAGAATAGAGSFAGGAEATLATMTRLGISTTGASFVDGSGLSRDDRVTAGSMIEALTVLARGGTASAWPAATGLPVAGFTGTLADRFLGPPSRRGAGVVRAKTGTLTGVSALAGLVRDRDGRLLAFAFMADDVPSLVGAREAMDRAAGRLAGCGCR
jgi:D-alanyl-D-alanine carboxypeptidase/D-alanyl-D-alanine-endopeptidase (penicillin-binding protein 4)